MYRIFFSPPVLSLSQPCRCSVVVAVAVMCKWFVVVVVVCLFVCFVCSFFFGGGGGGGRTQRWH